MNLLLFFILCLFQVHWGSSLPFLDQQRISENEYLHARPYSQDELLEVRRKLNLTMTPDPDEYLTVVSVFCDRHPK